MVVPDKLLINLKILSKIQKNGRISRSYDGIIGLESERFYQSLKRLVTSDSRKQSVFEINSIVNECIETVQHLVNSKYMHQQYCHTEEYVKLCETLRMLLREMDGARVGIENLKFTYQVDHNVVSQLDIIVLKLNTIIRDTNTKVAFYEAFLQPQVPAQQPSSQDFVPAELEVVSTDAHYSNS